MLEAVRTFWYAGLALLLFVETVFPPIPSEVVLPLAGFLVGRGDLGFWGLSSPRRSAPWRTPSSCTGWGAGADAR